jgi:hypothetical protein
MLEKITTVMGVVKFDNTEMRTYVRVKGVIGRDEGLPRSVVKPKLMVKAYALIDSHRF